MMKKIVYMLLVVTILVSGLAISCKKNIQEPYRMEKVDKKAIDIDLLKSDKIEDFNYIGEMHNLELEKLIIKTKDLPTLEDKKSVIEQYYKKNSDNFSLLNMLNNVKSETSLSFLDKINNENNKLPKEVYLDIKNFLIEMNKLDKMEISGKEKLEIVKARIEQKKHEIYSSYRDNDLFLLKSFYSVYINSSIYWSSKESGGLGKYRVYFSRKHDPNINVIASADAIGGLGGGILSGGNPLGAIVGAAVASINKAL